MISDVVKLLRDTAANFMQLAEALEQEQKTVNARLDFIEHTTCDTKQAIKEAANLILNKL